MAKKEAIMFKEHEVSAVKSVIDFGNGYGITCYTHALPELMNILLTQAAPVEYVWGISGYRELKLGQITVKVDVEVARAQTDEERNEESEKRYERLYTAEVNKVDELRKQISELKRKIIDSACVVPDDHK